MLMGSVSGPTAFVKRDHDDDDEDDFPSNFGGWYYSEEGRIIRYSILFGILITFFLFLAGSHIHAQQRMKKGLPPLRYHRWLVSRRQRAQFEPHLREPEHNFTFYSQQQQQQHGDYYMHAVPPPVYNPNYVQPPAYPDPPPGASKADPIQAYNYTAPPPGPGGPSSSANIGESSTTTNQRAG